VTGGNIYGMVHVITEQSVHNLLQINFLITHLFPDWRLPRLLSITPLVVRCSAAPIWCRASKAHLSSVKLSPSTTQHQLTVVLQQTVFREWGATHAAVNTGGGYVILR